MSSRKSKAPRLTSTSRKKKRPDGEVPPPEGISEEFKDPSKRFVRCVNCDGKICKGCQDHPHVKAVMRSPRRGRADLKRIELCICTQDGCFTFINPNGRHRCSPHRDQDCKKQRVLRAKRKREGVVFCDSCGASFNTPDARAAHIRRLHSNAALIKKQRKEPIASTSPLPITGQPTDEILAENSAVDERSNSDSFASDSSVMNTPQQQPGVEVGEEEEKQGEQIEEDVSKYFQSDSRQEHDDVQDAENELLQTLEGFLNSQ